MAMEATIFTGWIYDHLLPRAEQVMVAYPLMPGSNGFRHNLLRDAQGIVGALAQVARKSPHQSLRKRPRWERHVLVSLIEY
jgi:hypothetical protein